MDLKDSTKCYIDNFAQAMKERLTEECVRLVKSGAWVDGQDPWFLIPYVALSQVAGEYKPTTRKNMIKANNLKKV